MTEIINILNNELLKRKEIKIAVEAEGNLGFKGAAKIIVDEFKESENLIVVKNVLSNFGSNQFLIEAFIYSSKGHMDRIEPKPRIKKKAGVK